MNKNCENVLLEKALSEVLVCPHCKGGLSAKNEILLCKACLKKYPVVDGIPVFLNTFGNEQEQERTFRDNLKYDSFLTNSSKIVDEIAKHHCLPVMRQKARSFVSNFVPSDWILDIGTGFAWHWENNNHNNPYILGIDFSMTNLKVARRLLTGNNNVLLACADAAQLPVRGESISGLWSAQVFQHFPAVVYEKAQKEIARVLKDKFIIEIVNLNPALLLRIGARFKGSKFQDYRKNNSGMVLNRFSAKRLEQLWRDFGKNATMKISYSELFFHPPYLMLKSYPMFLERLMAKLPAIAQHIARQVSLRIISTQRH